MSNRRDIQFTYNPHNKATILDCNFKVSSTDSGGLGITSLNKSGRIASVYMNTSATPATGNPNPQAGYIYMTLQDNYNTLLGVKSDCKVPLSGSNLLVASAGLTAGNVYVITVLGTTTTAQWQVLGVPANITPAVGVAFVAAATSCTGTGAVQIPATNGTGIFSIVQVGDAKVMNSNGANVVGAGNGMQLMFACYKDSSGDAPVLAAPADGTTIRFLIYLNNSSQGV